MGKHLDAIKVRHEKHTPQCATEKMPLPKSVCIMMSMHIGAPCQPVVKVGDEVKVGQLIGDTDAFVSAPIYSSVSGKVKKITKMRNFMGGEDTGIEIETDGKQELLEGLTPPVINSKEEFLAAVKASGLVGLGGASFPTHIKLNPKNLDEIDSLVINGAECEPYITSDHRTMLEDTDDVLDGIEAILKNLGVPKCVIGVEENKPDAIAKLNETIQSRGIADKVSVCSLRARYPQGAERVLVWETLGRTLNGGQLPSEVGAIVTNVTTVAILGQYLRTGIPFHKKRITVDGSAVAEPKNLEVLIGTKIADIIAAAGGYKAEPRKIIMGGPMMGRVALSDQMSSIKANNAILAFAEEDAALPPETNCIKCGRCHKGCPFNLLPVAMVDAYQRRDADKLNQLKIMQCMECGSCSYVCPARRPLTFTHKLAKMYVKEVANSGK